MSRLELLPRRVTPGAAAGESLRSSGVLLSPNRVNPGAIAQSCHYWSSCSGNSLLGLLPSHVTPGALSVSCHSWSSCRRFSNFQRLIAFTLSCHSWISCSVMSHLELLPSRVTPGTLSGEFLVSSGVLFSPSLVTPRSLVESCQPCKSCRRISKFQRRIVFAQSCHS